MAQYLRSSRRTRFRYLFTRHPLTILGGYFFVFFLGMCVRPFLREPRQHLDGLVAVVLHLAIAAAVTWALGWQGLLLTVLLPQALASALGSYLFYAQHNFPSVTFRSRAGWAYEIAAMESSSFLRTGPVMAWFTGNIGHHHIHHLNARIPFYRLAEAKRAIPELDTPKTTSLHPMEVLRCLRLKVWDPDRGRMVGMRECRAAILARTPRA
jgi:omega-6 fatty acid desaturase (delta-12 desaturase)